MCRSVSMPSIVSEGEGVTLGEVRDVRDIQRQLRVLEMEYRGVLFKLHSSIK